MTLRLLLPLPAAGQVLEQDRLTTQIEQLANSQIIDAWSRTILFPIPAKELRHRLGNTRTR